MSRPHLFVTDGELRWTREGAPAADEALNFIRPPTPAHEVRVLRDGLAELHALDGPYMVRWDPGRFEDTVIIEKGPHGWRLNLSGNWERA